MPCVRVVEANLHGEKERGKNPMPSLILRKNQAWGDTGEFQPDALDETNFDCHSLASGAGYVSDFFDIPGGAVGQGVEHAVPYLYRLTSKIKFKTTAAAIGEIVELRLLQKGPTSTDVVPGNLTANAALPAEDKLRNLPLIGHIVVDKSDLTEFFIAEHMVEIWSRYVALVIFNRSARAFSDTQSDFRFKLEPIRFENQ